MSSALRTFLYDRLYTCQPLQTLWGVDEQGLKSRVYPRRSQFVVPQTKPFLIYGLQTLSNEALAEDQDHRAERQFFQVWIHDEDGDYSVIDDTIPVIIKCLVNATHPPANVSGVNYLETSQEFNNETYGTAFRYIRFQAILSSGERIA